MNEIIEPHPATLSLDDLLSQCKSRRQRRSGPGGQHRNKVETAVVYTHIPTGVSAMASERRVQEENRKQALFRLRVRLALEVRCPARCNLSACWNDRVQAQRITISKHHNDFPAMLSEALDYIMQEQGDLQGFGDLAGCSKSQLVKFFKLDPIALQCVNDLRHQHGHHTLR
ncbi:MAG: peptide chain release factor-like protein [Pirellulaceae bacterium]